MLISWSYRQHLYVLKSFTNGAKSPRMGAVNRAGLSISNHQEEEETEGRTAEIISCVAVRGGAGWGETSHLTVDKLIWDQTDDSNMTLWHHDKKHDYTTVSLTGQNTTNSLCFVHFSTLFFSSGLRFWCIWTLPDLVRTRWGHRDRFSGCWRLWVMI